MNRKITTNQGVDIIGGQYISSTVRQNLSCISSYGTVINFINRGKAYLWILTQRVEELEKLPTCLQKE
ncbi:hypothetical protein P8452_35503 [Trifolium repens]|nr:hypothetical protein P8452_35503 [Trifolium repens]